MLVEFALFDQDTLLERSAVRVSAEAQCAHLTLFNVAHQLCDGAAKIVLSSFAPTIELKTVNLDMPVHQSADWESIEVDKYTIAFRCALQAGYSVGVIMGEGT
jgi:hypothetical protein